MKQKLLIFVLAALAITLTVTAGIAITAWAGGESDTLRVHQHQTARGPDEGCDCDGTELCSHLPLVIIETGGQTIPGVPTGERDRFGEETYTLAEDGREIIDVTVAVIDNQDRNNHPSDEPDFVTQSQFRVRGHASRHFEKAPYLLNFRNEDGTARDIEVMGMSAHNNWVLNGPYLDKSLVRNYLWYNMAGDLMDYAPNVRYCELIIDGEYRGLYLMVETITNGEEGRLNLRETVKDTELTGYLVRLDRPTEEEAGAVRDIHTYTERMFYLGEDASVRYPGEAMLTPELAEEIERDLSAFEKALYSYDYDTEDYGYWNWIDVESFVDYFLINELSRNADAGRYSTYLYKEVDGKLKLCVWDFNNACDNFPDDEMTPSGFALSERVWFFMLFKNQAFVEQVIDRYWELRETVFSPEYISEYIDEVLEYLGPAVQRNNERWAESITEWEPLIPEERNDHSQTEAVERLKHWLYERIEWLDKHIEALRQYSHPSRNKAYNH